MATNLDEIKFSNFDAAASFEGKEVTDFHENFTTDNVVPGLRSFQVSTR
jgi:hypothetical protein